MAIIVSARMQTQPHDPLNTTRQVPVIRFSGEIIKWILKDLKYGKTSKN